MGIDRATPLSSVEIFKGCRHTMFIFFRCVSKAQKIDEACNSGTGADCKTRVRLPPSPFSHFMTADSCRCRNEFCGGAVMFQKYLRICTEKVIQAINIGTMELANMRQNVFTPDFILLGLLEQEETMVTRILDEISDDSSKLCEAISDRIYKNQPQNPDNNIDYNADSINILLSPEIEQLFEIALDEARKLGDKFISTGSLFLAFFNPTIQPGCEYLNQSGLRYAEVYDNCSKLKGGVPINAKDAESKEDMLKVYGKDLVEMAQSDKLDPVVGRDDEIGRVIEILARRTKNNPIIIGQPGVGKTALVEGLAQRIAQSQVPETLLHRKVLQLDMARIVAGAKFKGEYEERMKNVIDSLVNTFGKTIAFIDDIHCLVDAGGNGTMRAIDMLSPVITRGEIQLIGTTSTDLYKKTIEKEKTLARRFQPLKVDEPTVDETVRILQGIKTKYENHHNVVYSDEALKAAATMSNRYINDRFLPDKAIDLLDEAGARRHLQMITIPPDIQALENAKKSLRREQSGAFVSNAFENVISIQNKINDIDGKLNKKKSDWDRELAEKSNIVTEDDIAAVISRSTGIPVHKIVESESVKLTNMEDRLHQRIIGQNDPIVAVSNAIRRNRVGLKDSNRPIGAFLFLGPTGVGKTELAKALAEFLFDDENKIIRLDMSEYMEKQSVARMIGSPPGYVGYDEGGQLTERVKRSPYSIVLLDELEKANEDVYDILLQIFDEGRLTDSQGSTVSFRNAIIIGTSNLGSSHIFDNSKHIGFSEAVTGEKNYELIKEKIMEETKKFFKPEFLNRIDDIIVFHPLEKEHIRDIANLMIHKLRKKVEESGYSLEITDAAKDKIAELGFSAEFGARPLRRVIENYIENPLSLKIISGEIKKGDTINIDENFFD